MAASFSITKHRTIVTQWCLQQTKDSLIRFLSSREQVIGLWLRSVKICEWSLLMTFQLYAVSIKKMILDGSQLVHIHSPESFWNCACVLCMCLFGADLYVHVGRIRDDASDCHGNRRYGIPNKTEEEPLNSKEHYALVMAYTYFKKITLSHSSVKTQGRN